MGRQKLRRKRGFGPAKRRDGRACRCCGSQEDLTVHHIVPLSKGGGNELTNLVTLCDSCHVLVEQQGG